MKLVIYCYVNQFAVKGCGLVHRPVSSLIQCYYQSGVWMAVMCPAILKGNYLRYDQVPNSL